MLNSTLFKHYFSYIVAVSFIQSKLKNKYNKIERYNLMCIICDWGSLSFPLNLNILTRNITYMNTKLTVEDSQHFDQFTITALFSKGFFFFFRFLLRPIAVWNSFMLVTRRNYSYFFIHRPNRNPH